MPNLHVLLGGVDWVEESKIKPKEGVGVWEGTLIFFFVSHLPTLFLIGNRLN